MAKLYSDVVIDYGYGEYDGGAITKFFVEAEKLSEDKYIVVRRERLKETIPFVWEDSCHVAYDATNISPDKVLRPSASSSAQVFTLDQAVEIILAFNKAAREVRSKDSGIVSRVIHGEHYVKVRPAKTLFGLYGIHVTRPEQVKDIRGPETQIINALG